MCEEKISWTNNEFSANSLQIQVTVNLTTSHELIINFHSFHGSVINGYVIALGRPSTLKFVKDNLLPKKIILN